MKRRTLTLLVLAPLLGEVLPGSTPPLALLVNPIALVYNLALYGAGALVVRELIRRRGLGWANLLLLGAAYGVLEEGLVVTSWFNPLWPDTVFLGGRGSLLGINWIWALGLTLYHAVVSIAASITVAEALFPEAAESPWLPRWGLLSAGGLLLAASLFGLLIFGFLLFKKLGYAHPPGTYVVALAAAGLLTWASLRLRFRTLAPSPNPPPRLWTLRLLGLAAAVVWFWAEYVLPGWTRSGLPPLVALAGLAVLAWTLVRRWSARTGFGQPHRLALVSGVLAFFVLLEPVVEFGPPAAGKPTAGLVLVGLGLAALLVWLSRRARPAAPAAAA